MSLVSTGLALTHRTTIERDGSAGTDDWGTPDVPDWQPHQTDLPCRLWAVTGREDVDGGVHTVESLRMIVPLGTDVTVRDRIGDVTSRGVIVANGPLSIRAILPRKDHLDLVLARIA